MPSVCASAPLEVLSDENFNVTGLKCQQMELGEPDASGRRRPIPVEGSEFVLDLDCVIAAIGTSPNPLIRHTTPGLETNRKGCIVADDEHGITSKDGVFAGGDTSDILNCGIDIRVSPPGKAVKTITLLSGGEKAFVAIALYFAILKLRPTPFCVLDEIEAALDDVNVQRFAKYIRRLTDSTQFIVITHRRGTMEEADMLYGVTMQEQGVSKMLMLNLAEAEKRLKNTIK